MQGVSCFSFAFINIITTHRCTKKVHISSLREVKYTYTKKDDLRLEANTATLDMLEAFSFDFWC